MIRSAHIHTVPCTIPFHTRHGRILVLEVCRRIGESDQLSSWAERFPRNPPEDDEQPRYTRRQRKMVEIELIIAHRLQAAALTIHQKMFFNIFCEQIHKQSSWKSTYTWSCQQRLKQLEIGRYLSPNVTFSMPKILIILRPPNGAVTAISSSATCPNDEKKIESRIAVLKLHLKP